MTELTKIKQELEAIKFVLIKLEKYGVILGDYIPEKLVMSFFNYSDTKLREIRRENKVVYSKVGSRRFYSVESILKYLNENKINSYGTSN